MDLTQVLAQLRKERDALDGVIAGMERLELERQSGPEQSLSLVTKRPANGTNNHNGRPHPVPEEEKPK